MTRPDIERLTELHGKVGVSPVDYFNNGLDCWLTDYNGEILAEAAHPEIGESLLEFSGEAYNAFPSLASYIASLEAKVATEYKRGVGDAKKIAEEWAAALLNAAFDKPTQEDALPGLTAGSIVTSIIQVIDERLLGKKPALASMNTEQQNP